MDDNTIVQEPVVAYGTNSYTDVMSFLHTMSISPEVKEKVGRRLVLEVTAPFLSKAFNRLDHLALLKKNWDGYGAVPVSCQAINNLKSVLLISDDEDWEYWMISPAPNGALALQSKKHMSSICIGDKEFSYYCSIENKEEGESHIGFSPTKFLETMRRIV